MISRNSSRSRITQQSNRSISLVNVIGRIATDRLQSPSNTLKNNIDKSQILQKHIKQVETIKVRQVGRIRSNKPIDLKESMNELKNYIDELRAQIEHQRNKKDHLMRVLRIKS